MFRPLFAAGLAGLRARHALLGHVITAIALMLAVPALAEPLRVDLDGRHYLIELPRKPQGAPILLALHGGGGDPRQFYSASGLGRVAAAEGYAVVFPAGSARGGRERLLTWNAGYCCGYAARKGVDDMGFLKAVIADATRRYGLDASKVFLTGMSNGSIMSETFAARNPGMVAAVAGVSGTMDTGSEHVSGPVPALIIHGTADTMVPIGGGQGDTSLTKTNFASVDSVTKNFLRAQPGTLTRTSRRIDARDDGTSVTITDYASGGQVRVRLIVVEGGAHHWPGGRKARLETGKTEEIDANTEILRFFAPYR